MEKVPAMTPSIRISQKHDYGYDCGYRPRSLSILEDREEKVALVGARDGSITEILLTPQEERRCLSETGLSSIEALFALVGTKYLLAGDRQGGVWRLRRPFNGHKPRCLVEPTLTRGPVTYISRLAGEGFLVSWRNAPAMILGMDLEPKGEIADLGGVVHLAWDSLSLGLALDQSGEFFWIERQGNHWTCSPIEVWNDERQPELEAPALVTGVTGVDSYETRAKFATFYVATDAGIYIAGGTSREKFAIEGQLHLPGIRGFCTALAHHSLTDNDRYLWAADSSGFAHLFYRDSNSSPVHAPRWRRIYMCRAAAQENCVEITSYGHRFLVVQTRRDDTVLVTTCEVPRVSPRSAADLLSAGKLRNIAVLATSTGHNDEEDYWHDLDVEATWRADAQIAELIEWAGERHPADLLTFLADPGTDLAIAALRKLAQDRDDDPAGNAGPRLEEAIYSWTYALMGTIARHFENETREEAYLGALRWLRRIGDRARDGLSEDAPIVHKAVKVSVHLLKKWGLFGRRFTASRKPLHLLANLSETTRGGSELENLILDGLIFQRQFGVEDESSLHEGRAADREAAPGPDLNHGGFIAEDMCTLRLEGSREGHGERCLVGVSLRSGEVRLYEVKARLDIPYSDYSGHRLRLLTRIDLNAGQSPEAEHAISRTLALGVLPDDGRIYLLVAPSKEPAVQELPAEPSDESPYRRERGESTFRIYIFPWPEDVEEVHPRVAIDDVPVPGSEGVHTLLKLAPNLFLAGLEGKEGRAHLVTVRLERAQEGRKLELSRRYQLHPQSGERKVASSNPVTALACLREGQGKLVVFVGCRDGQIWRIQGDLSGFDRVAGREADMDLDQLEVGRLRTPISALACREHRATCRVFAGSGDGTVMAWQRLGVREIDGSDYDDDDGRGRREEHYVSLWTTQNEADAIVRLHAAPDAAAPDTTEPVPLVALTRGGDALLFSDREKLSEPRDSDTHFRLLMPGSRLAQIEMGARSFASVWLDSGTAQGMAARLAVASDHGVKLVSLYYPERSRERQRKFLSIVRRWECLVGLRHPRPAADTGWPRGRSYTAFRQPELALAADSRLPRMFLAWLFQITEHDESRLARLAAPDGTSELTEPAATALGTASTSAARLQARFEPWAGPIEQWFPRILRPLVRLVLEWDRDGADLGGPFKQALKRTEYDPVLYREVLKLVIRRSNRRFFQHDAQKFAEPYRGILRGLREVCDERAGKDPKIDADVHRTMARELPDGDLLWRMFSPRHSEVDDMLRKRVPQERLALLDRWLDHDHPLVALETLRASNLSILTTCRRLRREKWPGRAEDEAELPWHIVARYHEAVKSFTGRAAHSAHGALSDAVSHEIARAYALCMFACPSAIALLTSWIYQMNLPNVLLRNVDQQLQLLVKLLGFDLPRKAREIHGILMAPVRTEKIVREFFGPETEWKESEVGKQNAELIAHEQIYEEIVQWLDQLTDNLAQQPARVTLKDLAGFLTRLRSLASKKADWQANEYPFRHSLDFWTESLTALDAEMPADMKERSHGNSLVSPRVVLFSHKLAKWARESFESLGQRRKERLIFDPYYRLYRDALDKVRQAAAGFRDSSAVHKNVVLQILDHGLLARLDEHLLELWEVAQVLDPYAAWQREDETAPISSDPSVDETQPTASRFSSYLLNRARKAESIPKNLRQLRGLLGFPASRQPEDFAEFLHTFALRKKWQGPSAASSRISLQERERHFLHLCLSELALNHEEHGATGSTPEIEIGSKSVVTVSCRFHEKDTKRVEEALAAAPYLETLIVPRDDAPQIPSLGVGLYIASLAAATAGWELEVEALESSLVFKLTRSDTEKNHEP